uniref:(California timema) hypothetical protein n=1 Tax=Timema californicum TaxID=61474 RepID=A0A7R9J5M1_TIMCA|nr:unnamed protein product [Timema californicum]
MSYHKLNRTVKTSKYEMKDIDSEQWWNQLFTVLEEERDKQSSFNTTGALANYATEAGKKKENLLCFTDQILRQIGYKTYQQLFFFSTTTWNLPLKNSSPLYCTYPSTTRLPCTAPTPHQLVSPLLHLPLINSSPLYRTYPSSTRLPCTAPTPHQLLSPLLHLSLIHSSPLCCTYSSSTPLPSAAPTPSSTRLPCTAPIPHQLVSPLLHLPLINSSPLCCTYPSSTRLPCTAPTPHQLVSLVPHLLLINSPSLYHIYPSSIRLPCTTPTPHQLVSPVPHLPLINSSPTVPHLPLINSSPLYRTYPSSTPLPCTVFQPPECRDSVLRMVLPRVTYQKVSPILHLEEEFGRSEDQRYGREEGLDEGWENPDETYSSGEELGYAEDPCYGGEEGTHAGCENQEEESSDRSASPSQQAFDLTVLPPTHRRPTFHDPNVPMAASPYLKFLKKPHHRAASWRPLEPVVTPTGIKPHPSTTLNQRAQALTNSINKNFCDWLLSLGGLEQSTMTEEILTELFQIGFDTPAAHALCVKVQEMPVIPRAVARAVNVPQAETRAGLRRELLIDAAAEKGEPHLVAFGECLPADQRFKPPKNRVREKWLQCDRVPPELESMEAVWKGITGLRSTKGFVEWLKQRPNLPRPKLPRRPGTVQRASEKDRRDRDVTDALPPFNSVHGVADALPPFNSVHGVADVLPPFNSARGVADALPPFNSARGARGCRYACLETAVGRPGSAFSERSADSTADILPHYLSSTVEEDEI